MAEVKTFEFQNCIVRVHFPDLTEDERKRRMNQLKKATADLLKHVEMLKKKGEEGNG